tara:strand:- start:8296 stop:8781 length:486 start_codon:yes stop_codon:yes gene_type:complete
MKKISYIICSIFLLITLSGCAGYEPVFGSKNFNFKIINHSVEGEKILGNKIYSQLYNLSKSSDQEKSRDLDLYINVTKIKSPTSKNSAGKILEYQINLNVEIKMNDNITEEKIINQVLSESAKYKVQDQYSKTLDLEIQSIENIINNIYQDILIIISTNLT